MTRKTTRRSPRKPQATLGPQTVLLAGIGAVSLGRKQALRSIDDAVANATALRQRADDLARQAGERVAKLKKQAESRIAPARKQAGTLARQAQATVEARLAPVLARFGVKPAPAKRPRRAARPAAKRARKRA